MKQLKDRRKVMVVSPSAALRDSVKSLLPKEDFFPVFYAATGGEARRLLAELPVDIIIVDCPLSDEHGVSFAESFASTNACVMLLVKPELLEEVATKVEEHGVVTLAKPTPPELFLAALRMLSALSFRLQRMESEKRTLQEKMADIRVINRAKLLLVEKLKMTESDAHRRLEKTAMDERKSKREVAEAIISQYATDGR